MVTNNTEPEAEPIQAPAPESNEGAEFQPDINPLISEVDRLNGAADVNISEPIPEVTQADQTATEEPVIPEPVTAESPVTTEEPIAPEAQQQQQQLQAQPTPQQLTELQRQSAEYEQVRQRAAVQQEYERVQSQLESQGASPEEAQQQASQYIQSRTSQQDLMRQADAYGKELIAKQNVFECYTRKVISELPDEILNKLENVDVVVSSRPTEDQLLGTGLGVGQDLLGIYEGIPITERYGYELVLPDKITLFQDAIESLCATEEEIMIEIKATITHEIAHHFGLDDQELEELNI